MRQKKLDSETQNQEKADRSYEKIFKYRQETFTGFHFDFIEKEWDDGSPEERRELYEKLWKEGGFRFWLSGYKEVIFNKKANDEAYKFWAEKTRARIEDPRKRDILAPLLDKQPHT